MPNKTIRPDFFIFVIVSKKKRKKRKNAQNFFGMRIRPKFKKNKKNLTYSFVLHLFGFDIK